MSRKSSQFELVRLAPTHSLPKQVENAYENTQKQGLKGLMKQLGYNGTSDGKDATRPFLAMAA